jgi:hypothetical protein
MMRSWENRPDTLVCDEPFYAYYLLQTGVPHPGADEVIRHQENDWRKVVAQLIGNLPAGKTIFFQKHMTHHLLPEIDRGWFDQVSHAFLIREPSEVINSFIRVVDKPRLQDTGLPQQLDIFADVRRRTGAIPPVIDAKDVLQDPERLLPMLCQALDVEFSSAMLAWPPGPRNTDGIWAKYWYDAVWKSTSFQPYSPREKNVPPDFTDLLREAGVIYGQLHEHRLGQ